MDSQLSDAIRAIAYSAAAGVGIVAITKYYTHKIKTAADRIRANSEYLTALKDILDHPNYNEWLTRRANLARELIERNPKFLDSDSTDAGDLERTLNTVTGDLRLQIP